MVIGDVHRNQELHEQYRHHRPVIDTPPTTMAKMHSGNRISCGLPSSARLGVESGAYSRSDARLSLSSLGSHEDYHLGLCGYILLILSYALICLTFPFSLTVCLKVSLARRTAFVCSVRSLGRARI